MTAAEARVASALIVTLCGLASAAAAMVTAMVAAVVGVIVRVIAAVIAAVIADVVFSVIATVIASTIVSTIVRTGRIGVNALNAAGNRAGNTVGGNFHSPRFAGDLDGGIRLGFGGNYCRRDGFTGGRALAVPVAVTASGKGRQAVIHRRQQTA